MSSNYKANIYVNKKLIRDSINLYNMNTYKDFYNDNLNGNFLVGELYEK